MKKVLENEEKMLAMMKKSSVLFPEKKHFNQFDDLAIGQAAQRKKLATRVDPRGQFKTLQMGSFQGDVHSPTASKKKAVTLMLEEPDGTFKVETASPKGDVV